MNLRASQLTAVAGVFALSLGPAQSAEPMEILENYADIAYAKYEDSLAAARDLDQAIDQLITAPSDQSLAEAKQAWLEARVPYQQTEVYRFGNPIVDDWEGKVNAWPLDEGLIDYVDSSYGTASDDNTLYTLNVIASANLNINGRPIDASEITPDLLAEELHEAGGIEANVATGYHAIEFLLWGQDLNGTGPGAGARPASDFDTDNCTNGNCDRRGAYLKAASELLITDLEEIVDYWSDNGAARAYVMSDSSTGLRAMLTGLGSLSYGELAGERMKLGLLLHDPEEEHDCFADNTHNSHYYNQVGMLNVMRGSYKRTDGSEVKGASLADLITQTDEGLGQELDMKMRATYGAMRAMKMRAESQEAYDQMIGEGNIEGNAVVQAVIDGLIDQTVSIERAVAALNLSLIEFEGSDSLDAPEAVFQ